MSFIDTLLRHMCISVANLSSLYLYAFAILDCIRIPLCDGNLFMFVFVLYLLYDDDEVGIDKLFTSYIGIDDADGGCLYLSGVRVKLLMAASSASTFVALASVFVCVHNVIGS